MRGSRSIIVSAMTIGFPCFATKPANFKMSFELGRIHDEDEGIRTHARVLSFDDAACKLFFRRRRHRTVHSGKIDDVEGFAEIRVCFFPEAAKRSRPA